ncbi:MAG TPA: porin family protein [Flavobacteriales bacterium]|nr:porin family protein [Flavobacteriales bacterium]
MKKVFALIAAAVLGTTTLIAQDDSGVRLGIKLAPNMGFVKPDTKGIDGNGAGFGYTWGLLAEFPFGSNGNYRFATGLFMNNLMGKWKTTFTYQDAINGPMLNKDLATDVKLQYVELPLTVKLMTKEIGYMRYYGQLGFGAAFNISAKANTVTPKFDATGGYVVDFTEENKVDFQKSISFFKAGLVVGGGFEYNFSGSTSLLVGVTYNNGLTNILDISGAKAKASYVELTTGVFF